MVNLDNEDVKMGAENMALESTAELCSIHLAYAKMVQDTLTKLIGITVQNEGSMNVNSFFAGGDAENELMNRYFATAQRVAKASLQAAFVEGNSNWIGELFGEGVSHSMNGMVDSILKEEEPLNDTPPCVDSHHRKMVNSDKAKI